MIEGVYLLSIITKVQKYEIKVSANMKWCSYRLFCHKVIEI